MIEFCVIGENSEVKSEVEPRSWDKFWIGSMGPKLAFKFVNTLNVLFTT